MAAILSTDGTVSFPEQEVYGVGTVRIMKNFEVAARALDTPRHISEACIKLGFVKGDRVIVAERSGQCRTVTV